MKRWFPALVLALAVLAVWWFGRGRVTRSTDTRHESAPAVLPKEAIASKTQSPATPAVAAVAEPNSAGVPTTTAIATATAGVAVRQPAGNTYEPDFTNLPPEIVLEKVAHVIRDYASMFGGNPVGTNPEIAAALDGHNPRQSHFLNAEFGMRLNANGELVDPWGTPYFFHQLSANEMEIHSAGPDRIIWTADDLVQR